MRNLKIILHSWKEKNELPWEILYSGAVSFIIFSFNQLII